MTESDDDGGRPPAEHTDRRAPWVDFRDAIVALGCALIAVTCAAAKLELPAAPSAATAPGLSSTTGASAPSPASASSVAPAAPAASHADDMPVGPLGRFRQSLLALRAGMAAGHVRILWLGDSHTAADFWTGSVRDRLDQHFGAGGPGFLRIGVARYRHDDVKLSTRGRVIVEPTSPSRPERFGDGVLGLGGIRVRPSAQSRLRVELSQQAVAGGAQWEVTYRLLDEGASFNVVVDDGGPRIVSGAAGVVEHFSIVGQAEGSITLSSFVKGVELLGLSVESTSAGVVLDTLGIDGARVATPLAWDEESWVKEVGLRQPVLFVLAYGTNEVVGVDSPAKIERSYAELLGRLRRAAPTADCLIIGPTDVARGDGSHPRVLLVEQAQQRVARQLGCEHFSAQQAMGGDGSFVRWMHESPVLASADGVHLTRDGYTRLGELVVDELLGADLL